MKRLLLLSLAVALATSGIALGDTYGSASLKARYSSPTSPTITFSGSLNGEPDGGYYLDYDIYIQSTDFSDPAVHLVSGSPYNSDHPDITTAQWLNVFCIDIHQDTSGSYKTYQLVDLTDAPIPGGPMGNATALLARELIGQNTPTTEEGLATIQLALWDLIFDDGNLSAGEMTVANSTRKTAAQAMLDNLDPNGTLATAYAFVSATYQDWAIVTTGGPLDEPIPEPGTIINLIGLALAGGLFRYRRLRLAKREQNRLA